MQKNAIITSINKFNFNEVVNLVRMVMGRENPGQYKRSQAFAFLDEHYSTTRVLEINDEIRGAYTWIPGPNATSLTFFALDPLARKTRGGYLLYKDMKKQLGDTPLIVPIYNGNKEMEAIVKKRGTFLGRFPSSTGGVLDYYSLNFDNFKKKGKQ